MKKSHHADPVKHRENNRRSYHRNKAAHLARSRKWVAEHPEQAREIWRKSHARPEAKARRQEVGREWRKQNAERSRINVQRRRHRVRSSAGDFSKAEWDAIIRKQRGRCAECGKKRKLTIDHVVPVAKGGCNYAFNLQGLCRPCNTRKHIKFTTSEVSLFDEIAA